jgi:hypothetical protein
MPETETQIGWRLFRPGAVPTTLYHKHVTSSKLPTDVWLNAVQRVAANPGKIHANTRKFRAGFHIFPSLDELVKYSKHMNPEYRVCRVYMSGKIRRKPGSRSSVLLATQMYVRSSDWLNSERLGHVVSNGRAA